MDYGRLNRLGDRARRVTIYDSIDDKRMTADFLGVPDPTAPSPEKIVETVLVPMVLTQPVVRVVLAEALGLPERIWALIGEPRSRVFPDDPPEKPGDFDIIVGPLRSGRPEFDRLAVVEVKRSPVRADGKAKSPSGFGTKQARNAAKLGFDQVLLLHLVLGPDESIRTPVGKAPLPEHDRAVQRVAKSVKREDPLGPGSKYGVLVIEWARARGASISRTGAFAFTLAFAAPVQAIDPTRRGTLEAHLRGVLPSEQCPEVLHRCPRCDLIRRPHECSPA